RRSARPSPFDFAGDLTPFGESGAVFAHVAISHFDEPLRGSRAQGSAIIPAVGHHWPAQVRPEERADARLVLLIDRKRYRAGQVALGILGCRPRIDENGPPLMNQAHELSSRDVARTA